jgi:hypothetical protein
MRRMALVAAAALALAGCLEDEGPRTEASCLEGPAPGRPAVVALLGQVQGNPTELHGPMNELVRISLPGGKVEARRGLGPRWKPGDAGRLSGLARVPSGPLLAPTPDGGTVLALVRNPVSRRSSVAVVDVRSLRVRCSHPLEPGVLYSGLLLGRSGTVYAVGARRAGRSRSDALVTMADADTGRLLGTRILREADQTPRVRTGKSWWAYWAALSADERRLLLSYHGGDTTGADSFRVRPGSGVSGGMPTAGTDADSVHGAVYPAGTGFVAATGSNAMLRLDRRGRQRGRFRVKGQVGHLMDFEIEPERRLLYVSACGARPAIIRLELRRGRQTSVPSGDFCGYPLAHYADRFLVLDAERVDRWGYPSTRSAGLRLLDLRRGGPGRAIPSSTGAFDAVVVGTRR